MKIEVRIAQWLLASVFLVMGGFRLWQALHGVQMGNMTLLMSSGEVLRFVRKGGIVSVSLLEGAKAEALEIILPDDCEVIGKSLKDIKLPRACLVCAVVHDNEAVVPNGNTVLYAGDRIIIFVKSEFVKRVMPFFESRG